MIADKELYKLQVQQIFLRDVLAEYPTATLSCAIRQIQSRIEHIKSKYK